MKVRFFLRLTFQKALLSELRGFSAIFRLITENPCLLDPETNKVEEHVNQQLDHRNGQGLCAEDRTEKPDQQERKNQNIEESIQKGNGLYEPLPAHRLGVTGEMRNDDAEKHRERHDPLIRRA